MGRLQRKYGFTIDNLLSVDLVTADGTKVHSSKDENADLFWGLRGAGANFGVATSFEYQLHPQETIVTHGLVALPVERSSKVGALVRDVLANAPDELFLGVAFGIASDPPFPPAMAGTPVMMVGALHSGSLANAERDLRPLRTGMDWSADTFMPKPYLTVQAMADESSGWGKRFYMKGAFLPDLSDELLAACAVRALDVPAGGDCSISCWAQGGAVSRTPDGDMAFTGRTAGWSVTFEAQWEDPAQDDSHISWTRRASAAVKPFTTLGQYVNDVADPGTDAAQIYGTAKYERLVALKRKYDPGNVFRLNQNIRPSAT
jgi:hypothetical protein